MSYIALVGAFSSRILIMRCFEGRKLLRIKPVPNWSSLIIQFSGCLATFLDTGNLTLRFCRTWTLFFFLTLFVQQIDMIQKFNVSSNILLGASSWFSRMLLTLVLVLIFGNNCEKCNYWLVIFAETLLHS